MPHIPRATPEGIRRFVLEYIKDLNVMQAYERAFNPNSKKVQRNSGNSSRFFHRPDVQEAVQKAMDKRAAKIGFDGEKVLEELARIAFSNVSDLYDENGALKDLRDMPRSVSASLAALDVRIVNIGDGRHRHEVYRVKLWDKPSALEKLGKHLKLFHDTKVEVSQDPDGEPLIPKSEISDVELARRIVFLLEKPLKRKKTT